MGHGMSILRAGALAAVLAACGWGQTASVRVYSVLQRIDPFGNVVSLDRAQRAGVKPREILSPAIGRNCHVAFHVAVTVPEGDNFTLYIGQNPDDFFNVTLYKETYVKQGDEWIPDGLTPVTLPYAGRLPDTGDGIPGQTTVTFLMDVFAPPGAGVQRTKLEPELYTDGRWIIYPMEVRVVEATVPEHAPAAVPLAPVSEPADRTVRTAVRSYLCGEPVAGPPRPERNIRWFIMRDVMQDMVLARARESAPGSRILPILAPGRPPGSAARWCEAPVWPEELGPEWYLRVRDAFYREVQ
jgi:hypothetical protein